MARIGGIRDYPRPDDGPKPSEPTRVPVALPPVDASFLGISDVPSQPRTRIPAADRPSPAPDHPGDAPGPPDARLDQSKEPLVTEPLEHGAGVIDEATASPDAVPSDRIEAPDGTPISRLRETIEAPAVAIADNPEWHLKIIAEHRQEALFVVEDLERVFPRELLTYAEAIVAITKARQSGNLMEYEPDVLGSVLIALAQEVAQQLVLPGVFIAPTDLISAFFAAAQLGAYAGA